MIYEFGAFRLDSAQRLLLLKNGGRALPLTSRAFDTLLFFVEHRGQMLDKATLLVPVRAGGLFFHGSTVEALMGRSSSR